MTAGADEPRAGLTLFDPPPAACPATRENVAALGACPLCAAGPGAHDPEDAPRHVPDDAGFGPWFLSLPRTP